MPDPKAYDADQKQQFISDCIQQRQDENANEDVKQSAAVCYSLWSERSSQRQSPNVDDIDDPDLLECINDLMDNEGLEWDEAYRICSERGKCPRLERRASQLEVRAKGRKLFGHAALFNVEAHIGDFTEVISPGAFRVATGKIAQNWDTLALVDHDPTRVLARTRNKTLRLAEDDKGLAFDLDLPNTSYADDIRALVEGGIVGGMSFGFTVPKGGEQWDGGKRTLRTIDLKEISVVSAWPAYPGTTVHARARKRGATAHLPRLNLARRYLETL